MSKKSRKTKQKAKKKNFFKGRTAVFIDAANLEKSVADFGTKPPRVKRIKKGFVWKAFPKGYFKIDYKELYKFFKENTKLASVSFYSARFGVKSHDDFLAFLKRNRYRLVTKPIKEINTFNGSHQRKANFDVEISVDAVDWIKNYDVFILISGDSDFAYLLEYLKKKGKKVVVISERGHISKELVKSSDVYRELHEFKSIFIVPKKQKSRR